MLHRVVKPFPFSWNGFTLVDLNVGDKRDFGSMADGLVAIGLIEAEEAKVDADAPVIDFTGAKRRGK
ncbi:hypothetical protein CN09_11310 [Rhizobium rhizogenes]|nr:hypothetical protein CN09_11310 [Rhizobium rhizogenes]